MKSMQKGFTLIELMIVVAIIAILAAIAIPQYQDYITRSQFSESQTVADGMKVPIQEYASQTGNCPTNGLAGSGIMTDTSYAGKYVAKADLSGSYSATTGGCIITITFKGAGSVSAPLVSKTATFTMANNGGTINWVCDKGNTAVADKYKPQVCRGN